RDAATLRAAIEGTLAAAADQLDYVEIVHPDTLAPVTRAAPGSMALVAAYLGKTRLIDNVKLP
ncbi:MAG: pantoate--beta-alanine ligase, partial [Anaeromyxobacteraceae bacterium]